MPSSAIACLLTRAARHPGAARPRPSRRWHAVHHHSAASLRQSTLAAVGRGQKRRRVEPRVGEAVVAAVLEVGEEVADDGDRDEEAHVVGARKALEGDAGHAALLHHRPAAVAGVDGGVRLHDEVRVGAAVHVAARLDARDDAGGGGDVLPAEREAVGVDPGAGCEAACRGRADASPGRRPDRRPAARPGRSRSLSPRGSPRTGWPGRAAAPAPAARRRSRGRSSGCVRRRSGSRCRKRRSRPPGATAATSRKPSGIPARTPRRRRRRCRRRGPAAAGGATARGRGPRGRGRRGARHGGGFARARPVGHRVRDPRAAHAGPREEEPGHRGHLLLDRAIRSRCPTSSCGVPPGQRKTRVSTGGPRRPSTSRHVALHGLHHLIVAQRNRLGVSHSPEEAAQQHVALGGTERELGRHEAERGRAQPFGRGTTMP